jgi:hypothetical protein
MTPSPCCAQVIPNSAIYFYQFTSPAANKTLWTTRFAIASDAGATTPPPKSTQPDGQAIPWGVGKLANPADAKPPPSGVSTSSANATTTSAASVLTTASSSILPTAALPATTTQSTTPISGTETGAASTATGTSGSGASSTGGAAALSVDGRVFGALIASGVTAFGFISLL